MEKKNYEKPELEIAHFIIGDLIGTYTNVGGGEDDGGEGEPE